MKKLKLKKLRKLVKEILSDSFELCKHDDPKVADKLAKINTAAHECLKHLEYEPEDVDD